VCTRRGGGGGGGTRVAAADPDECGIPQKHISKSAVRRQQTLFRRRQQPSDIIF